MKIAFFNDNFFPEMSGISDSITTTARLLAERNHQVVFFVPRYSVSDYQKFGLEAKELDLGQNVKIKRLFSLPISGPTKQARMVVPNFWRQSYWKDLHIDIIHTNLFFGAGLEALTCAKYLKVPLIGTNHTPIAEFVPAFVKKHSQLLSLSQKYVSWYYNHCAWMSAPSQSVIDEMSQFGFCRPAEVVSNPVEIEKYNLQNSFDKHLLKKEFGLSEKNIISTGRLAPEKHPDVLIKAIAEIKKEIPDISLALTGRGKAEGDLKKLVKNLKLDDNVKFFGFVDSEKLPKLYYASEIYAVASTAETQCMSMIQGMASGLPAIAVKWRGLAEYVNEKNGYLVAVGDYKAMAEKIIYLLQNKTIYDNLSLGAREFVQQFSSENIAEKWERIYQKHINTDLINQNRE
jgi:1,2-diacylglycerol 3-alpha-glucosyltransferase